MDANENRAKITNKLNHGLCIWFTGLSCAGKTTLAELLSDHLERLGRIATILDGDHVRQTFHKELGFSREDRDTYNDTFDLEHYLNSNLRDRVNNVQHLVQQLSKQALNEYKK